MVHLTRHAHELLARQHGVASTQQLLDTGLSARQLRHLQQSEDLELVLRGAYRTPSAPDTELARCAAVCAARSDVAIAGPTAGRLWGFRRLPADHRIHVLAPPASNPAIARWVVPYRTDALHDHDVVERDDGIRITTRAAHRLRPRPLARARRPPVRDRASRARRTARRRRLPRGGRRLVVSPHGRGLASTSRHSIAGCQVDPLSHIPKSAWPRRWVERGVRGLVRQHCIQLPGHGDVRFDLAVPELRWAIEVDLHPRHRETMGIDVRRTPRPSCQRDRLEHQPHHRDAVRPPIQRDDRRTRGHARRPPTAPGRMMSRNARIRGTSLIATRHHAPTDERTDRIAPLRSSQPVNSTHR